MSQGGQQFGFNSPNPGSLSSVQRPQTTGLPWASVSCSVLPPAPVPVVSASSSLIDAGGVHQPAVSSSADSSATLPIEAARGLSLRPFNGPGSTHVRSERHGSWPKGNRHLWELNPVLAQGESSLVGIEPGSPEIPPHKESSLAT
nr:hypothetical protein Iba_chr09cCG10830 [Ipomoea batatas]